MPVVDDRGDEAIATVSGLFIHPDLGKLEGLFVRTDDAEHFLAVQDIVHWGRTIVVRDSDVLGPLDERVRLSTLWSEGRTVLGQKIVTESGTTIGRCSDVQFETETFRLEWLFPRKWLHWKRPIPAAAIIEVRPDCVLVRDFDVLSSSVAQDPALAALETIGGSTTAQS